MNGKQVLNFVLSYIEATGCQLIEKSPAHVTFRLSAAADRALTGRPYYWTYVDRTGTEPQTMSYSWMFQKSPPPEAGVPATTLGSLMTAGGPVIREEVYFGSRRLAQLFEAVRYGGRCVTMFEEPPRGLRDPLGSLPYTAWLGVNFKVGYECDMKREELYGWGISLATGNTDEKFLDKLKVKKLTPRLPSNVHLLKNGLSLRKGMTQLEHTLERRLKNSDFTWAVEADGRRQEEQNRINHYYGQLIERAADDAEQSIALKARLDARREEIDWQYRPRVNAAVLNCGIFYLPGIN